jgi:hypothetical protein
MGVKDIPGAIVMHIELMKNLSSDVIIQPKYREKKMLRFDNL